MNTYEDDPLYREPPRNLDAEQALLGAILINSDAHGRVADILEPQHFSDPLHGAIYQAAAKLIADGRQATPITLKTFFDGAEPVREMPVPVYLGRLAINAATIINVHDYARTIVDLWTRRQLILTGEDMVNAAYNSPVDFPPKEQIEEVERRLYALAENRTMGHVIAEPVAVRDEFARVFEAYRNPEAAKVGISTGLADVDRKLGGGLQPSDLIILAGRPAMGKTALAGTILRSIDRPAVFFSLEMTAEQIARRMISAETGIPTDRLRSGDLSEAEASHLVRAERTMMDRIEARGVILDQTGGISIANLATRARRLKRQVGIELVIVDYLQLVTTGSSRRDGRVQEVSEISGGLKALAKELNVPVLALSQLSREVEKRQDKRPFLADLRESGSIEQDADVVMFVFREEYYVRQQQPSNDAERAARLAKLKECGGKGEIIIGKHRHGSTGTVDVHFDATTTLFSNLAGSQQEHPR
jgi:replicative DNA helicase